MVLERCFFKNALWGSNILLVGFVAVGIATFIGVVLGSLAGFYRGWVDSLIMRFVDIMLSIPTFLSNISCNSISNPINMEYYDCNWLNIWMGVTRLVRAEFFSLRQREYVLASETMGSNHLSIIIKHLLPNSLTPISLVQFLG